MHCVHKIWEGSRLKSATCTRVCFVHSAIIDARDWFVLVPLMEGYTEQFCTQPDGQSVDTFLATKELFCNVICRHLFPCFQLLLCCGKTCLSGRLNLLLRFWKNYFLKTVPLFSGILFGKNSSEQWSGAQLSSCPYFGLFTF